VVTDEQGHSSRRSLTAEALRRLAERQKQRSRQFFRQLEIKDPVTVSDLVLVAGIPQSADPAEVPPARKPGKSKKI
jgi:hypothetical protein